MAPSTASLIASFSTDIEGLTIALPDSLAGKELIPFPFPFVIIEPFILDLEGSIVLIVGLVAKSVETKFLIIEKCK